MYVYAQRDSSLTAKFARDKPHSRFQRRLAQVPASRLPMGRHKTCQSSWCAHLTHSWVLLYSLTLLVATRWYPWYSQRTCCCRFDRQISIDRPDITGREQIFRIHLARLKLSKPVDYFSERLAALTPSFAGGLPVFSPSVLRS